MKVGTKSLLFGVHQFLIHPWFVAAAWWQLYGFPCDLRLWVAFFVHDWGYWGSSNIDGDEGERHPLRGALIMSRLFDRPTRRYYAAYTFDDKRCHLGRWGEFVLLHSRFYSRQLQRPPSRLCYADKLAICLTPIWLYLPLAFLTGEIKEYMALGRNPKSKYAKEGQSATDPVAWYHQMQSFVRQWVRSEVRRER